MKTNKPKKKKVTKNVGKTAPLIKQAVKNGGEPIHNIFKDKQAVIAYSLYGEILFEI